MDKFIVMLKLYYKLFKKKPSKYGPIDNPPVKLSKYGSRILIKVDEINGWPIYEVIKNPYYQKAGYFNNDGDNG